MIKPIQDWHFSPQQVSERNSECRWITMFFTNITFAGCPWTRIVEGSGQILLKLLLSPKCLFFGQSVVHVLYRFWPHGRSVTDR